MEPRLPLFAMFATGHGCGYLTWKPGLLMRKCREPVARILTVSFAEMPAFSGHGGERSQTLPQERHTGAERLARGSDQNRPACQIRANETFRQSPFPAETARSGGEVAGARSGLRQATA